ncbi:MAG: DUF5657 family protein [Candidatus Shapirobacteria bacterium]
MPYFLLVQKFFFIACSFLYFIFALIVVKQVTSMSKNVHDKFNPILISFSFIHLIFSGILIFLILLLL